MGFYPPNTTVEMNNFGNLVAQGPNIPYAFLELHSVALSLTNEYQLRSRIPWQALLGTLVDLVRVCI